MAAKVDNIKIRSSIIIENIDMIKDPYFRKLVAYKKVFSKFQNKTFVIKDEKVKYKYEVSIK